MIAGRERELELVRRAATNPAAWPAATVLLGQEGIGKTTLWQAGVDAAADAGIRVLSACPAEPEATLSFATLSDLLTDVAVDVWAAIPEPQRTALSVVSLQARPPTISLADRAVAAAFLSVVRTLARRPLLIAVDEIQWMDEGSARVFAYAIRRLHQLPVGVVVSARGRDGSSVPPVVRRALRELGVTEVTIGPLPIDALGELLTEVLGKEFARSDLKTIHEQAEGNPFFALEMARAAERGDPRPTGLTLPIPTSLRDDLARRRFAQLTNAATEILLLAAASARPTVGLLERLMPVGVEPALEQGERIGVIAVRQGDVRFSHPLFRSALYAGASRAHRHRLHAALAEVVEDPEERGRHLALSTDVANAAVADAIEAAARIAGARGAHDFAAWLLDNAVRLTPVKDRTDALKRRLAEAAERARAGTIDAAVASASDAVDIVERGNEVADARWMLAWLELLAGRPSIAQIHLTRASEEPDLDEAHRSLILSGLARTSAILGDLKTGREQAVRAVSIAPAGADRSTRAQVVASSAYAIFLGGGTTEGLRSEVPDVWGPIEELSVASWPQFVRAIELADAEDVDGARAVQSMLLREAEERGDELSRVLILCEMSEVERAAGGWEAARLFASRAAEAAEVPREVVNASAHLAWFSALMGDPERADRAARRALDAARSCDPIAILSGLALLADLELVRQTPGRASELLASAIPKPPSEDQGRPSRWWPVAGRCLLVRGEIREATAIATWLERRGQTLKRSSAVAGASYLHGAVADAMGSTLTAAESYERAALLASGEQRGRALLALGSTARRAGDRARARDSLLEAREIFDNLAAVLVLEQIEEELSHIAGRPRSAGALTESEMRVARLAAAGKRNREIAETLTLSVRTIESHLSSVYSKLGVRSRTELVLALTDEIDEI